jgi:hypothetical protein
MKRLSLALALVLPAVAGNVHATVLPFGDAPLNGTTVAATPRLAGLVLEDVITPFSFVANGGTTSGTVQSRVVRSAVDGTLDFYWRIQNDANSSSAITSFRLADFYTSVYDANYRIDGLGDVSPGTAHRFPNSDINFLFDRSAGPIASGNGSFFIFLDTNALNYMMTARYDLGSSQNGAISGSFSTFAPGSAVVPEPETYALLFGGFASLALSRRQRHE